jgi:phosphatidylserine/phosphatidylglycerophosphate/cardiolipin synthase-like enzyme
MEVLYWQLAVVISVAAAYLLSSRWTSLVAALLWTGWTVLMLHYTPLVVIQIGLAWTTFLLLDVREKKNRMLKELEVAIAAHPQSTQSAIQRAKEEHRITPLQDSEHYPFLIDAIRAAKTRLVILSGWLSDRVIDDEFLRLLRDALRRGVQVLVGFGYEDSRGVHNALPGSDKALAGLLRVKHDLSGAPGKLRVGRFNNHEKILVRDRDYVVCGSHNWLSNRAFINKERSFVVKDPALADQEFLRLSQRIAENEVLQ